MTLVDCCLAANKDIALSVVIHARPSILKYYDTAKQENRKKIIIIFTRLSVEDLRFFIETYAHDRYLFKQLAWDCAWRKLTNHVRVLLSVGADLVGENFDLFFHSGEIENTIELIHLLMSHGCVFSNVGNRTLESLLLYIVQEPARLDDLTDIAIILESSGAYLDPTKTLCLSTMDMVRAHYEVKMRPIYVRAAYTIRRAATEILYRPGGIGYHQAMNNFFELARRL